MKCKDVQNHLIDLVYDEADPQTEPSVREHLESCDHCRAVLEEMQETAEMLSRWEDADAPATHIFMHEPVSPLRSLGSFFSGRCTLRKLSLAIPALLLLLFLGLSAANFNARFDGGRWHISMSLLPGPDAASEEALIRQVKAVHQQTLILVAEMLEESREADRQDMETALARLERRMETQRLQDLQMVGRGMEGLHLTTEGRIYETNARLNDLIRLTGYRQPQ